MFKSFLKRFRSNRKVIVKPLNYEEMWNDLRSTMLRTIDKYEAEGQDPKDRSTVLYVTKHWVQLMGSMENMHKRR